MLIYWHLLCCSQSSSTRSRLSATHDVCSFPWQAALTEPSTNRSIEFKPMPRAIMNIIEQHTASSFQKFPRSTEGTTTHQNEKIKTAVQRLQLNRLNDFSSRMTPQRCVRSSGQTIEIIANASTATRRSYAADGNFPLAAKMCTMRMKRAKSDPRSAKIKTICDRNGDGHATNWRSEHDDA